MKYILLFLFILSLGFVSAIPNDANNKIDFTYPKAPINYSTIATVNSSDFWDNLDTPLASWLSTYNLTYHAKVNYQFLDNNFNGSGWFNTTGNISANALSVDHIAEKEEGHGVVFDNDINLGSNALNQTYGSIVSEVNPDAENAIRWKGNTDSMDVRIGGVSGYFNVYDSADVAILFYVNDSGDIFTGSFVTNLIPSVHNTKEIGSSSVRWKNLYLSNDASIGRNLGVTGAISSDAITVANAARFERVGVGVAASANTYEPFIMEVARANNYAGMYLKNTESDGISRFNLGMTLSETTKGLLMQYDNEDGRGLYLNRKATTGTMELITTGGGIKVGNDGGVIMLPVYSDIVGGTNRDLFIDDTGKLGYVSSSIRYKENIRNLTGSERIYDLNPVLFDRKDGSVKDEVGLIAEEVEQVMPELVSHETKEIWEKCYLSPDDSYDCFVGYKQTDIPETVSYSKLVIPLLKEIQNLKAENEMMKDELCVFDNHFSWC